MCWDPCLEKTLCGWILVSDHWIFTFWLVAYETLTVLLVKRLSPSPQYLTANLVLSICWCDKKISCGFLICTAFLLGEIILPRKLKLSNSSLKLKWVLLSNSENREWLKNFRNVDCVVTNLNEVQDMRANHKLNHKLTTVAVSSLLVSHTLLAFSLQHNNIPWILLVFTVLWVSQ